MIVAQVFKNQPSQVGFIEHDHVVQPFPPATPHPSFGHAIGLSRLLQSMGTVKLDVSE